MSPQLALQQVRYAHEFYAHGFLSTVAYQQWQHSVPTAIADAFVAFLQTDTPDETRWLALLAEQPNLVKAVLARQTQGQIEPWYQAHPSACLKRHQRQQHWLLDALYILCARYKKHCRQHIWHASQGRIGSLGEAEKGGSNLGLAELERLRPQRLNVALQHYHAFNQLQYTLTGDHTPTQKLQSFITTFDQLGGSSVWYPTLLPRRLSKTLQKLTNRLRLQSDSTPIGTHPWRIVAALQRAMPVSHDGISL